MKREAYGADAGLFAHSSSPDRERSTTHFTSHLTSPHYSGIHVVPQITPFSLNHHAIMLPQCRQI
jgi:hypothetical protein